MAYHHWDRDQSSCTIYPNDKMIKKKKKKIFAMEIGDRKDE